MKRLFCPKCGNSKMERVSYSLDRDGRMTFYTRANRPSKLAGTNFSLPKPKGGRNGDLLLRKDQILVASAQKVVQRAFGENVAHDLGVKADMHNCWLRAHEPQRTRGSRASRKEEAQVDNRLK
ncbi:hypothetical protein PsorP6_010192 [Peronosclerospora sorghi]|uniref:Uncharacterized protein n=1 Tax=Peronosclerospora sorghi TaxID=230839 RepID=A0ACC0VTV2_9STRA|nr:hypothetical protein PsorP6_010192 [Peronosclerospora sorghi]